MGSAVKNLLVEQEMQVRSMGGKDPRRRAWKPTRVLAWRIPRTEEPGGLQSIGSQRVEHD